MILFCCIRDTPREHTLHARIELADDKEMKLRSDATATGSGITSESSALLFTKFQDRIWFQMSIFCASFMSLFSARVESVSLRA